MQPFRHQRGECVATGPAGVTGKQDEFGVDDRDQAGRAARDSAGEVVEEGFVLLLPGLGDGVRAGLGLDAVRGGQHDHGG